MRCRYLFRCLALAVAACTLPLSAAPVSPHEHLSLDANWGSFSAGGTKNHDNFCATVRFTPMPLRRLAMVARTLFVAVLLLTQAARATPQDGRDEIFPPKAAAQDAIHWKAASPGRSSRT